jgi:predicted NAD/FAD-dependent oxidoreductase
MAEIPRQIASGIPEDRLKLNTAVQAILPNGPTWQVITADGQRLEAARLIIATERPAAARLVATLPQRPTGLQECHPEDVGTHCIWFTTKSPLLRSSLIHLNADPSHGPIHNLAELSTVAPEYLPVNYAQSGLLAATFLDREWQRHGSAENVLSAAIGQLGLWFGVKRGDIRDVCVQSIPFAQPGQAGFASFLCRDNAPGLIFAGDYLTSASINGALKSGRLAAEAVMGSQISVADHP